MTGVTSIARHGGSLLQLWCAAVEFARSCVASPLNCALTGLVGLLLYAIVPSLLDWAIFDATWRGTTSADCANANAACWVFIKARFGQIVYGAYPVSQRWRVDIAFVIALVSIVLLLAPRVSRKPLLGALLVV